MNIIAENKEFIKRLFSETNDFVEIREIENGKVSEQYFFSSEKELLNYQFPADKNIRLSIFTRTKKDGTSQYAGKTKVIFADYDNNSLEEIKNRLYKIGLPEPSIIVNSGHGYHIYWELYKSVGREVIPLYKALARRTGADIQQAGLQAGGRLPGTYNVKETPVKCEIVEMNEKKYQLNFISNTLGVSAEKQDYQVKLVNNVERPCIKSMLTGVNEGQRNFALGRITKYLQQQGYSRKESQNIVLKWNERNDPPENKSKIIRDFKSYWRRDYKLLGCRLNNDDLQQNLSEHCNRYDCPIGGKIDKLELDNSVGYNNRLLQDLRQLSGKALLVYGVLSIYPQGLNTKQLEDRANISDYTRKKAVNELDKLGYIRIIEGKKRKDKDFYKLKKQGTFQTGRTIVSNGAINGAIHKVITFRQLKIYILLLKYAMGKNKSYPNLTTLGKELGITKQAVSNQIQKLQAAGYIEITHDYNKNAVIKNYYRLLI